MNCTSPDWLFGEAPLACLVQEMLGPGPAALAGLLLARPCSL
jgi:hypothetical protein